MNEIHEICEIMNELVGFVTTLGTTVSPRVLYHPGVLGGWVGGWVGRVWVRVRVRVKISVRVRVGVRVGVRV